jgi:Ca2+/Na+ antiporter
MTDNPKYPAKTSELVFANGFLAFAAHAFVYQDVGRKHYGEFVLGHAAIAVGVIIAIMALWSTVHYFRRVPLRHGLRRGLVSAFAVIVVLCMSSQLGLWHLNATLWVARLSIFAVGLLAWPVIAGAAAFFQEIQKQEKPGPTTSSTATNEPAAGGSI